MTDPFRGKQPTYPVSFLIKIIVQDDTLLCREKVETVMQSHHIAVKQWKTRKSRTGKYTTLITTVLIDSREHLYALYSDLESIECVVYII